MTPQELLTILSLSANATAVYTTENIIIEWANDTMISFWGKDRSVIGKPLADAVPELKGQPFIGMLQNVWRTGITYELSEAEASLLVDGRLQTFYFDFEYRAILNEDGSTYCILHTATNVTERIANRRRTEESEHRYETLFTSIDDGFCIIEKTETGGLPDYVYVEANPAFVKQTGVPDIKGKTIREIFPSQVEGISLYDKVLQSGQPVRGERYARDTDRYMEYYACVIQSAGRQQVAVVFKDISERKKDQFRLEESEERFRTMAETSDILIATSDEQMNTSYLNNAWFELTGVSVENLLRFGWVDLLHPDDKDDFLSHYLSAFNQHIYFNGEFRIKSKNGDYRWLYVQCPPRFRADGSFAGYIASAIDITERKQDEQRKNDFIAMVSHEMKTPLTSLSGYLQMVQMKAKKEDAFTANMLNKASKQVNKITTLINGFLNVSRLESGKIHINKQRFDMAELVKEAEEETMHIINSHEVVFAPVKTTWVHADKDKISQVITNLISNAVKYSPANTVINVACETIDGYATVSVSDKGIGIKKEDQARLFDRYYRVNEDQHTAAGFGIGLYLCSEIIQRHDGKIWVESEVGKGSTFSFRLPVEAV